MTGRPTKRDQILEAARRCFNDHGITATGVDAIAAAAEVSKRTLYNHFPSKEDLVVAYIDARERRWRGVVDQALGPVDDPVERIYAFVDAYFTLPDDEEFRGCPLLNAAAETPGDDSRVLDALRAYMDRIEADIVELVRRAGFADADGLGRTIGLLLEGALALYGMRHDADGARAAAREATRRALASSSSLGPIDQFATR